MQRYMSPTFVEIYLVQKRDIYRCICYSRGRFGFYAEIADYFWDSVEENMQPRSTEPAELFFFFLNVFWVTILVFIHIIFYYSMMIDEGEDGAGVGRRGGGSCCGFSSSSCRLQDRVFRVFCKAPWAFSLPVTWGGRPARFVTVQESNRSA